MIKINLSGPILIGLMTTLGAIAGQTLIGLAVGLFIVLILGFLEP